MNRHEEQFPGGAQSPDEAEGAERVSADSAPEREADGEKLAGQLEEKLNAELQREHPEQKQPKIKIHIFFGTHGNEEDAEKLRGPIAKADIYIPERVGWSPNSMYAMEDVAQGRVDPDTVLRLQGKNSRQLTYGFVKRELEILYNSQKPVLIIDVPNENGINKKLTDIVFGEGNSLHAHNQPHFARVIKLMRESLKSFADTNISREDYMLVQLKRGIERILKENPHLEQKNVVQALMFLGAAHTRVYHAMKRGGQGVTREFSSLPFVYDNYTEAFRRMMLGKEVSKELVAHVLLQQLTTTLLRGYLLSITSDNEKITRFLRAVGDKFAYDEIKNIFESKREERPHLLAQFFTRKGIEQPYSEADIDAFIGTRTAGREKK